MAVLKPKMNLNKALHELRYFFRQIILPYDLVVSTIKKYALSREILDIGAGTGLIIKQLLNADIIDFAYSTEISQNYFKKTPRFEITSFEKIEKFFDCISLIDVLHHVKNKEIFLKNIIDKVAQNNTFVIIKDISPENFFYRNWNTLHDVVFNHDYPEYISENALQELMLLNGFELIESFKHKVFWYDHFFQVYKKN